MITTVDDDMQQSYRFREVITTTLPQAKSITPFKIEYQGAVMFQKILENELKRRGLSYREAAKQIGISHSTLIGASRGTRKLDVNTALAISKWVGIPLASLIVDIDPENAKRNSVVSAINTILNAAPKLEETLVQAANEVEKGTLTLGDFQEILDFATYKISRRREEIRENEGRDKKGADVPG